MANSASIKLLFASASQPVIEQVLEQYRTIFPELPLLLIAEFEPTELRTNETWVRYHIHRTEAENEALLRDAIGGRTIRLSAVILEPRIPHWPMRRLGFRIAPLRFLAFNETGSHFMLRPGSIPAIVGHGIWRLKNLVRSQLQPKGKIGRLLTMLRDPVERQLSMLYRTAIRNGEHLADRRPQREEPPLKLNDRPAGISVVIPSRNGRELLARCLPSIPDAGEIIVVDNGSDDGTAQWLAAEYPNAIVESSTDPLPFSVAVNRGIRRSRYSHVCLLNNDMVAEPGFLHALRSPFDSVPDLFCTTAQIFFPEGQRREETGKTVIDLNPGPTDFPIRCDEPLEREDQSYVLYGSGGCSLYDAAKLESLGSLDEIYKPAYVEDLDLGVRAWLRGWPSVYVAGARVLHEHRATTSRYLSEAELDLALESNFIHFLARAIPAPGVFRRMWHHNTLRLKELGKTAALSAASEQPVAPVAQGDLGFLDLCTGLVCVFPGRSRTAKPVILIASPYLPFPLSHGAAVRIFNLMREASKDFDLVLVAFVESPTPAPPELLELCVEVVIVHRPGSHALPSRGRPDTVEEFDTPAFHQALQWSMRKWSPKVAQLEFTQMAIYAPDCTGARTILVEHDITYDLYAQMIARATAGGKPADWELRHQHDLWRNFEEQSWKQVDRVVTMSPKDRGVVEAAGNQNAVAIPNGVDLARFVPSTKAPEQRRLLFIGSFAHKPNVLALEFFLRDIFSLLQDVTLHVIAGQNHTRFWDLQHQGVEVDGFVSDVRTAYHRAAVVIAPLVASAGTNVKILEAMAMGKAIVSTEAGIHGIDLVRGKDVIVADEPMYMAREIHRLLDHPEQRAALERAARSTAERVWGWDAIARGQAELYHELAGL